MHYCVCQRFPGCRLWRRAFQWAGFWPLSHATWRRGYHGCRVGTALAGAWRVQLWRAVRSRLLLAAGCRHMFGLLRQLHGVQVTQRQRKPGRLQGLFQVLAQRQLAHHAEGWLPLAN